MTDVNLCLQSFMLSSYVSILSGLGLTNKPPVMFSRGSNVGCLSEGKRADECWKKSYCEMHFKENSASDVSLSCMSQKREKRETLFPIMETTLQLSILTTGDNAWKRGPDSKEKA